MSKRQFISVLVLLSSTVAAGCAVDGADRPVYRAGAPARDALTFYSYTTGTPRLFSALVGKGLNGRRLTGELLDGRWIESVSLDKVQVRGRLRSLELRGTALRFDRGRGHAGRRGVGATRRPAKLIVGAILTATLDDGSTLPLRIDGVERSDEPGLEDLLYYFVSYPTEEAWTPLCGVDDTGEPVPAIPLSGAWSYEEGVPGGGDHLDDERVITFGCRGFVLSKCVEMGYRPWVEGWACEDGPGRSGCAPVSLRDYHQACTRMLRADYCGDGTSYTLDGTYINAYDGLGIRADSEDWLFEAEWDAGGARCVTRERLTPPLSPHCFDELLDDRCGAPEHFAEGTLLMSETEPAP